MEKDDRVITPKSKINDDLENKQMYQVVIVPKDVRWCTCGCGSLMNGIYETWSRKPTVDEKIRLNIYSVHKMPKI